MTPAFDIFQTAVGHHQAGRLDEAEQLYHQLVQADPRHADALHLLGVISHQRGRHGRAVELIERAITLNPSAATFHTNIAEAYRVSGDPVQAERHGRRALELQPDSAEAYNNLGLLLQQMGRPDEAVPLFEAAIGLKPFWPLPFLNLGNLHRDAGRTYDALAIFREGVRLCPDAPRLRHTFGSLLLELGQPEDALLHCEEAVRRRPDEVDALITLGAVRAALGHRDAAEKLYLRAVELAPGNAAPYGHLASIAQSRGHLDKALDWLARAVQRDPSQARYRSQAGSILYELGRTDDALAAYREAIRLKPDAPEYHNAIGFAFQDLGDMTAALVAYRDAVRIKPDYADAYLNMGILYTETGDHAEAVAAYREALRHDPEHPEALAGLALILRGKLSADEESAAERMLARGRAPERRKSVLRYGLAHVMDARGEYDRAAALTQAANDYYATEYRLTGRAYSPDEHSSYVDQIISAYSAAHFERVRGWGDPSQRPVFVLGMPRSGTSLVEQILASHPEVFGAGELNLMRDLYRSLPQLTGMTAPGVECVDRLDAAAVQTLASRYLARLGTLNADRPRVVDKMPDNYLMLGLIATLFPNARIIHTRRDMRDVGLSLWMTHFKSIRWACDLEHIGRRINDYRRLMSHWRTVLPGRLLEVDYEALAGDIEGHARRLLDACGLEWNPACLAFHETKRVVRTASMAQVREPVYHRSIERWRRYESHLTPLLHLLGDPATM